MHWFYSLEIATGVYVSQVKKKTRDLRLHTTGLRQALIQVYAGLGNQIQARTFYGL